MQREARPFDLIVFGGTGCTGRLAARYLARRKQRGFKWAIAGRNAEKLAPLVAELSTLPHPPSASLIIDHSDWDSVRNAVSQTQIALSFAGPFGRYGESVVAACTEFGTHYLDITGETFWVNRMIEKYESTAQRTGAILIPFSGFDSVPADLGAWRVTEEARRLFPNRRVTQVLNLYSMRGGVNGGTFQTLLDILALDSRDHARFRDSALLVPQQKKIQYKFEDPRWPRRIPEEDVIGAPFFMSPINSRVVYRSQALRSLHFSGTPPFEYSEYIRLPGALASAQAWGLAASSELFNHVGRTQLARKLLKTYGPKSGDGPSDKALESGFFKAQFFAYAGSDLLARDQISFAGDPGNKSTVLLICESALCLLLDHRNSKLPGGFWTASTALGTELCKRLQESGVKLGEKNTP